MSLTEQYALDLYRAARRGEPAPPAPGRHDWRTVRELREYRDVRAVTAGRPARRRGRRDRLTDAPGAVRAMSHAVRGDAARRKGGQGDAGRPAAPVSRPSP
ncbi:hypothetical protein [Streptomyces violaceusniger]|uniref:Uncharacterized protein n=1 Tax=Streptomyces violaceusniger (strain Tu 4113) TaxID=653045 RepID=G2P1B8_STRV4|nr:hypothetical protein [Streptomyces violaceusniger]AEM88183.1 hypothetical protein Strvi_8882 [Streptomyces violaceusniger Tu 4113]